MKKFIVIIMVFSIFACTKEDSDEVQMDYLENSKSFVIFNSWDDFYETYETIAKLNDSQLVDWVKSKGHDSYLLNPKIIPDEKGEKLHLTRSLEAILNENKVFRVDADFIILESQNFYSLNNKEFMEFKSGKLDLTQSYFVGKIETVEGNIISETSSDQFSGKTVYLDAGDKALSDQLEFTRFNHTPCGGTSQGGSKYKYKYVHQLITTKISIGYPNVITELFLDVKLEYHSGDWRNAGLYRNITINVSGTAESTSNNPRYTNFDINRSISCVTSNQRISLAIAQYPINFGPEPDWIVSGGGLITQHINGDSSSRKWYHNANW